MTNPELKPCGTIEPGCETYDKEIRAALHEDYLRCEREDPTAVVLDEFNIHASVIDVAVFSDCLHGYEIKSSRDSLVRLSRQIDSYKILLQKLTIVTASNHLHDVLSMVPPWCGIIEVVKDCSGNITFNIVRPASDNPEKTGPLVRILWTSELKKYIDSVGVKEKDLTRYHLWYGIPEHLRACGHFGDRAVLDFIKECLPKRSNLKARINPGAAWNERADA